MLAARRFLFIATVGGIPAATYDCDFTTLTTLTDLTNKGWTYSRTGLGTYVDSTGTVVYNRHNLCLQSQNMSVTWSLQQATVTYPVVGATAPDGSFTVSRINENTNPGSVHSITSNNAGISSLRDYICTASVYLKEDLSSSPARPTVILAFGAGIVSNISMAFDIRNGVALGAPSIRPGTEYTDYGITSAGNGWYRCWLRMKASYLAAPNLLTLAIAGSNTAVGVAPVLLPNGGLIQYNGAGVAAGWFAWGAQMEVANAPRDYIPTTTAQVYWPRLDPVKGLLIEAGNTNSLNWSEAFLTAGGSVMNWVYTSLSTSTGSISPNGLSNALKFTHTGAGPQGIVAASGPVGTTNIRALSFWARRVTGTGTVWYSLNNGIGQIPLTGLTTSWQRYEFRATSANHQVAIGLDVVGDEIELWGIQLENWGWPTQYVHTANTTVARAGDSIEMRAAQASFLSASAGSVVADYAITFANFTGGNVATFVRIGQGGAASAYGLGGFTVSGGSSGSAENQGWTPYWYFSAFPTFTNLTATWSSGVFRKAGFNYTLGSSFRGFINGANSTVVTPSASMTTLNKLDLATSRLSTGGLVPSTNAATNSGMWIKRLQYWNTSLSDSDMTTLTT
jgi:hypothetical protein